MNLQFQPISARRQKKFSNSFQQSLKKNSLTSNWILLSWINITMMARWIQILIKKIKKTIKTNQIHHKLRMLATRIRKSEWISNLVLIWINTQRQQIKMVQFWKFPLFHLLKQKLLRSRNWDPICLSIQQLLKSLLFHLL